MHSALWEQLPAEDYRHTDFVELTAPLLSPAALPIVFNQCTSVAVLRLETGGDKRNSQSSGSMADADVRVTVRLVLVSFSFGGFYRSPVVQSSPNPRHGLYPRHLRPGLRKSGGRVSPNSNTTSPFLELLELRTGAWPGPRWSYRRVERGDSSRGCAL